MTEPESFTAAQAADPATPAQVLADIAALRPDLRVAVAGNPSAYPGLVDWLKGLGEPAIDAAIAARSAAPPVPPVAAPMPPAVAPAPAPPAWTQAPAQPAPPSGPAYGAPQLQPPYGAPQPQPPYGAPQPPYGAPQPQPPYGAAQPQPQPPYGPPAGMPPAGLPPAGAPPYGQSPKRSNRGLVVTLVVLGVLVLLGAGAFLVVRGLADDGGDSADDAVSLATSTPGGGGTAGDETPPGDDPELDTLWLACADEDWQACDELYDRAEPGSAYFEFADTCGHRWDAGTTTYCAEAMDPEGGDA